MWNCHITCPLTSKLQTRVECFRIFIINHMQSVVVMNTNNHAKDIKTLYPPLEHWIEFDSTQLQAFFSLLKWLTGIRNVWSIWLNFGKKSMAYPFFESKRALHFNGGLMYLRFNYLLIRQERKAACGSKAEAIRFVFKVFIDAWISSYVPGPYIELISICVLSGDGVHWMWTVFRNL